MHLPTFHELTSGFNALLENYKNMKGEQIEMVREKMR
jgi:hypothetical protein